jgi:hypothetical protein
VVVGAVGAAQSGLTLLCVDEFFQEIDLEKRLIRGLIYRTVNVSEIVH